MSKSIKIKDAASFIAKRYGTANPFTLADKMNIDVKWCDLGSRLLGKTQYYFGQPTVLLNRIVQDSPKRYDVLAHEIGHVVLHEGVAAYYHLNKRTNSKSEYEAAVFSTALLTVYYEEDQERLPQTLEDLHTAYGVDYNY